MRYNFFSSTFAILLALTATGCANRTVPPSMNLSPGDVVRVDQHTNVSQNVVIGLGAAFEKVKGDPARYFSNTSPRRTDSISDFDSWQASGEGAASDPADASRRVKVVIKAGREEGSAWGSAVPATSDGRYAFEGDAAMRAINEQDWLRAFLISHEGSLPQDVVPGTGDLSEFRFVNSVLYSNKFVKNKKEYLEASAEGKGGPEDNGGIKFRSKKGTESRFFSLFDHSAYPSSLEPRERSMYLAEHWRPVAFELSAIPSRSEASRLLKSEPVKVNAFTSLKAGEANMPLSPLPRVTINPGHTLSILNIEGAWQFDRFAHIEDALAEGGASVDITNVIDLLRQFSVIKADDTMSDGDLVEGIKQYWRTRYAKYGMGEQNPIPGCSQEAKDFEAAMSEWVVLWLKGRIQKAIKAPDAQGKIWIRLEQGDFFGYHGPSNRTVWKRYCGVNHPSQLCHFDVPPRAAVTCGYEGEQIEQGVRDRKCFPLPTAQTYCLLAYVDGRYEAVGLGWKYHNKSSEAKVIYFGMNDDICGDNEKSLTVSCFSFDPLEQTAR